MKTLVVLTACGSLALSGCMTSAISKMTPDEQVKLINAFAAAGCKGSVVADAGGATGQLGGSLHAGFNLVGSCDPANAPKVVPLRDIDQILTPALPAVEP